MAKDTAVDFGDVFGGDAGDQTAGGDQGAAGGDQTSSFIDRMTAAGFDNLGEDESAARDRLLEAFTSGNEAISDLQGRFEQLESMHAATVQMINQAPPHQKEPDSEPPQTPWPNIPAANLAAWQKFQQGDAWKDGTPDTVINDHAAYQQAAEDWTRRLLYQPQEALRDPIRYEVGQVIQEVFGCELGDLPAKMDLDGYAATADRMYKDAEEFLYQTNPLNQQPDTNRLTEFGQSFADAMLECKNFAQRYGAEATRNDQIEYAYKRLESTLHSLKEQNGKGRVDSKRDQRHAEHRNRTRTGGAASGGANRAGGVSGGTPPGGSPAGDLSGIGMQFADSFVADGGLG